jgi:hypothetical protein
LHGCFSSDQQEQDTLPYLPNWSENINAEYWKQNFHENFQLKTPIAPRPFITNFFEYPRLPLEARNYLYREGVAIVTLGCASPRWHLQSEREFFVATPIADSDVVYP